MKASELMIGDFLRYKQDFPDAHLQGKIVKVDGIRGRVDVITIDDGNFHESVHPDWLEPIHLTPEILEKNGFDVQSHENPAAFAYKKEDVSIVEVYWNGPERGYRCIFSYGDTRLRITCHFVHELQQAFRLCGVDKEITI